MQVGFYDDYYRPKTDKLTTIKLIDTKNNNEYIYDLTQEQLDLFIELYECSFLKDEFDYE